MTTNRKTSGFLGYDLFKLIVALILLIILILLLLRSCSEQNLAAATEEAATQEATSAPTESATSESAAAAPAITSPRDGEQVEGLVVRLQGTGEPGTDLRVSDSGKDIGSVKVDSGGRWSFEAEVDAGQHVFVASTADGGLKSEPVSVTSVVLVVTPLSTPTATNLPPTATPEVASGGTGCSPSGVPPSGYLLDEEHYVVGSCDTLSGIAIWLNVTVESLLQSNPQITDPNTIIPGQIVNVPPSAD